MMVNFLVSLVENIQVTYGIYGTIAGVKYACIYMVIYVHCRRKIKVRKFSFYDLFFFRSRPLGPYGGRYTTI